MAVRCEVMLSFVLVRVDPGGLWLRDLMDMAAVKLPLINAPNLQKQGNGSNA